MSSDSVTDIVLSDDFKAKVKTLKEEIYNKYNEISKEQTPQVDGNGIKIIEKRPDGYDYIIESYMRDCLDRHFPGWTWEAAAPLQFLGSEWVVAQGHLVIIDEYLLALGISPPVRKFFGVDSVRVQFKKDSDHSNPANIVDVGDNCKQANTAALKYAINRLCHIGDDVYGKRIEDVGAGSLDSVLEANPDGTNFGRWISEHHWSWSEIMKILGVNSMTEVTDFKDAFEKVKEAKGLQ